MHNAPTTLLPEAWIHLIRVKGLGVLHQHFRDIRKEYGSFDGKLCPYVRTHRGRVTNKYIRNFLDPFSDLGLECEKERCSLCRLYVTGAACSP